MKRTVTLAVGALALGAVVYLSGRLAAQNPGQPAQPLRTRVALINISQVLKNYKKTEALAAELKGTYQAYEQQMQQKRKQIEGLTAQGQVQGVTQQQKEQLAKDVTKLQREGQDIMDEAKATINKKQAEQMTILYKEIKAAAESYARARDLELVLHYNDVPAGEPENPAHSVRRLTIEGCFPMYVNPGMEITGDIIVMLNNWYQSMMPKTPGAPTGN